jgi:hypothetical protein
MTTGVRIRLEDVAREESRPHAAARGLRRAETTALPRSFQ